MVDEALVPVAPLLAAKTVGTIQDAPEAQWLVVVIRPASDFAEEVALKERISILYANGSATDASQFAYDYAKEHNVKCVVFGAKTVIGFPEVDVQTLWEAKG